MNKIDLKASIGALAIAGLFSLSSCHPDPVEPGLADFCDDINAGTTWANNREGVDYRVTCVITVNNDMVIQEGTEIEFGDGAGIIVGNTGSLKVAGTDANRVIMRGLNGTGEWKGLWFQSADDNNELKYCTVNGAGQASFNGHDIKANVRLALEGKLGIVNSTISNSRRDGLFIEGLDDAFANPLRVFSGNTFTNNTNLPITTISSTIGTLDGTGSNYTGNGSQHIEIRGGRVYGNHSWNKNTIPYLVSGEIRAGYYTDQGNLTINSGVVMEFINNFGIMVGEYSDGYLKMNGTTSEHITLTTGDISAWQGVCFQSTNSENKLLYVDINKGGSAAFTGATQKKANIVIGGFSAGDATIENCTVNNSAAYGIFVAQGSNIPTITNVTYSGNAEANYYVEP